MHHRHLFWLSGNKGEKNKLLVYFGDFNDHNYRKNIGETIANLAYFA